MASSSNQFALRLIANQRAIANLKTNLRVKYFQMDPCKDIPKEACALKIGFRIGSSLIWFWLGNLLSRLISIMWSSSTIPERSVDSNFEMAWSNDLWISWVILWVINRHKSILRPSNWKNIFDGLENFSELRFESYLNMSLLEKSFIFVALRKWLPFHFILKVDIQ